MYSLELDPRFNDTDGLGHVNNAAFVTWMEEARRPLFRIFNPSCDLKKWNLILARVEIDYLAQCYFGKKVIIESSIEKVGNSSIVLAHEISQENIVAKGKSIMVHFDFKANKSLPIPQAIRESLKSQV